MSNDGFTTDPTVLLRLLDQALASRGDVAEIGVHRAHKYRLFLAKASEHRKRCHAIDSFRGMAEPTEWDPGYPRGKFDTGGAGWLRKEVQGNPLAVVHEGWVPDVLEASGIESLCYVHIDLDHYQPTVDAMRWAWSRVMPGGVMVCHDYYPGTGLLCSKAIDEWVAEHRQPDGVQNTWAWWVKP